MWNRVAARQNDSPSQRRLRINSLVTDASTARYLLGTAFGPHH